MRKFFAVLACITLSACAQTQAIRMSDDVMLVHTSAAPACGVQGSMRVAQKMAAVETLRAGYDRYIILGANAQNNVHAETLPGTTYYNGTAYSYGNMATYSGSSHYQPGPTIFSGSNDTAFQIKMFKKGQKGYSKAISARSILGPDWEKLVQEGVNTCNQ